jgi:hypothetical protein
VVNQYRTVKAAAERGSTLVIVAASVILLGIAALAIDFSVFLRGSGRKLSGRRTPAAWGRSDVPEFGLHDGGGRILSGGPQGRSLTARPGCWS